MRTSVREEYAATNKNILFFGPANLCRAAYKMDIDKQCRPWSDAAERGVWSGSTLFG